MSLTLVAAMLAICYSGNCAYSLGEEFSTLIRRVPESANALVLVNADRVFSSAVAKSEDWEANREERFRAGLTSIPPSADQMVVATQFDFEFMHPLWRFALIESEKPALLASVAREFGGSLDKIVGMPAVRLPDDSFIVELSQHLRGGMAPANRQQTSRWVGLANHSLSPYLTEAAGFADKTAHVIMVFDTTGAFSADEVATRMGDNMDIYKDVLRESPVEPAELAELLSTMRGITLGITFKDRAYGSIKVDFGSDVTKLAPIAKPLLLAVLAHRGAMIDEFNEWEPSVNGKMFILKGLLDTTGLARLSSLVELPSQAMATARPAELEAQSDNNQQPPKTMLQSTQEYFAKTESIMKDLRRHKGQGKSIGTYGLWFENYARKVERMPMLNVDEEMLDYGAFLSNQLRNCSMAIKGIGIQKRPAEIAASQAAGASGFSADAGGYTGYAGYGGYRNFNAWGKDADYVRARAYGSGPEAAAFAASKNAMRVEQAARVQVRTELKAKGAASVQEILAQIQSGTAQIRRSMTKKYQANF